MAIATSRKGPARYQLTQLEKFVMENGLFGQSIIQVDNEPAILQLAQEAAKELTIPWRHSSWNLPGSSSHTHQGQGAVERLHKTHQQSIRGTRTHSVMSRVAQSGPA
eukprot:3415157-Amphidinium_carterae.2